MVAAADPALGALIAQVGACRLPHKTGGDHFAALLRAIAYQQLTGRAAETIFGRLQARLAEHPTPQALLGLSTKELRAVGLSASKAASMQDLADAVASGRVDLASLEQLTDDEVVEHLVAVRGIGPWTAEMFLLFQLRRADVWPVTDYGVRKGYARVHGEEVLPTPAELLIAGERFRPYRSVAAWYLWRAVETVVPAL